MTDERDEVIERVRSALKPMPSVDPRSIARVLSAVHGRAPAPQSRWLNVREWLRFRSFSLAGVSAIAAVAVVLGFFARGIWGSAIGSPPAAPPVAQTAAPAPAPTTAVPASNATGRELGVPVQFVLDLKDAETVSVVSDFNEWNPTATPMQRLPGGHAWSATVAVAPGRHVYAFVINGVRWVADPRAPKALDADYGKPGSVLIVQTP